MLGQRFAFKDPIEMRLRRLRSLMTVFQKTNRILTGRPVTCTLVSKPEWGFPAWTVGTKMNFNDPHLGQINSAEDIVRITGLNYHELGHANFTPNIKSGYDEFSVWLRGEGTAGQQAYNILEDQRIESMLVVLFPSMRHYLTAMFVEFIMRRTEVDSYGNPKTPDHGTTFLLSHGRRYLGSDIRDAIRKMFVGSSELANDIADVIDRYRVLNLNNTTDRKKAKLLIERWLELIKKLPGPAQKDILGYEHATCNHGASSTHNTDETKQQATVAIAGVRSGNDDRDQMESEGGGDSDSEDKSKDWRSSSNGADGDSSEEGDDEDDGESSGGSSASSSGNESSGVHGSKKLDGAIAAALNEILRDKNVESDIRNAQNAMKVTAPPEQITDRIKFKIESSPDTVMAARRIGRRLQRIVEMQDPGWEQRTNTGRMNVQRAITGSVDLDELYDQWNPGNADTSSIEAVIIVDHSGSMSGHTNDLSLAAWAMKASFDSVAAPCTIYAYESSTRVVYEATERAVPGRIPNISSMGGTVESVAVMEAARRLSASKRKKRLFLAMTDGEWAGHHYTSAAYTSDEYIASMNKAGILTAMAFYPTGIRFGANTYQEYIKNPDRIASHGCQIVRVVKDMDGLVELTNTIIAEMLKRR